MTISEATCCEECSYFTRSKTKVQNANRREVQLHKMVTNVQSSYKLITGENYDDWVKSFPKNVKVDQHLGRFRRLSRWTLHLSAFCDESQGLQTSVQTAFNCSLRKTATMREMKSSPVLCDLIYCPRVRISHPLMRLLVSNLETLVSLFHNYLDFSINWASTELNWASWSTLLSFLYSQCAINSTDVSTRDFPCHDSAQWEQ